MCIVYYYYYYYSRSTIQRKTTWPESISSLNTIQRYIWLSTSLHSCGTHRSISILYIRSTSLAYGKAGAKELYTGQLVTPLVGFMNTRILYVQLITDLTESLTPDSVNVMWSSQLFRDECPLKEEWFGTPYSSEGYFPESHFSCQNYTPGFFFLQIYLPRGKMHGRVCIWSMLKINI